MLIKTADLIVIEKDQLYPTTKWIFLDIVFKENIKGMFEMLDELSKDSNNKARTEYYKKQFEQILED